MEKLSIYNTDIDSGLEHLESLETFLCYDADCQREGAKITELYEKELRNIDGEIQVWREFQKSPAQQWLVVRYPEDERGEIKSLNIRDKQLEGALKLKGFVKLERLNCQNNRLTNLDLSDCKNLTYLDCHKNNFSSLNFLKHVDNLEYLYISDCPELKGNLKPLRSLNKLKELDITNTSLNEGLEYLSKNCGTLYCNNEKIIKELEGHAKENKKNSIYYDLVRWRECKQDSAIASAVPLERLFVIRSHFKQFLKKWGGVKAGNDVNELSRLQSPEEFSKFGYLSGVEWASATATVLGSAATLLDYPTVGGVTTLIAPLIGTGASRLKAKYYDAKEKEWNEFLENNDVFLDNYHELLGILEKIEGGELGRVNAVLKNLREKVDKFLVKHDQDDNKIIDISELKERKNELANEGLKELQEITEAIDALEREVIEYKKGTLGERKPKNLFSESQPESSTQIQNDNQLQAIIVQNERTPLLPK